MAIRPTFMGFEMARRGLAVNQKGLDIVGNNLANVYTEGYTRQRLDVYSVKNGTYRSRFATETASLAGQGVGMTGVSQVRDSFLDKRFRDEYGDTGYYSQASNIMSDIEAAISDPESITDTGIKNSITEVVKALSNFVSNADSKVYANVVATTFKNLTQTIRQFDAKLNNIWTQQKSDLENNISNINEIVSKLQGINKSIADDKAANLANSQYYGPNELLDERNLMLDELAQYSNISVKENADGTVDLEMAGRQVLKGDKKEVLAYHENEDGTVKVSWKSDGQIYSSPSGGIQASLDMINGRGLYANNINDGSSRGIPFYMEKLNMFSNTLMNTFNNIVPEFDEATGQPKVDASGNTVYKQLLGASTLMDDGTKKALGTVPASASTITLSDQLTNDVSYLIYRQGDNSTEYPNQLLDAMKTKKHNFTVNGVTTTMTFSDFVSDYVSVIGNDSSFNAGRHEATASIANQLLDSRDEISAVSPDEETSNMLLYNKSYAAISRLMTTLDEALDKLINSTGLVGR